MRRQTHVYAGGYTARAIDCVLVEHNDSTIALFFGPFLVLHQIEERAEPLPSSWEKKRSVITNMFGQEIGAVVADIGTFSTRVGFAGEDAPAVNIRTGNNGFEETMQDGLISNWDVFEMLW